MAQSVLNRVARWTKQDVSDLLALMAEETVPASNMLYFTRAACQLRGLLGRPDGEMDEAA